VIAGEDFVKVREGIQDLPDSSSLSAANCIERIPPRCFQFAYGGMADMVIVKAFYCDLHH
jgi:hypothetical protein